MAKKSERKLLLWCMIFVFTCLLLHGGGRLIAGGDEPLIPARTVASVRAVLSNAPPVRPQTGALAKERADGARMHAVSAPERQTLKRIVTSDANGNVLMERTYMRAVYQAFTLDDGFV